jgi:thiamine pyrophosphokinase
MKKYYVEDMDSICEEWEKNIPKNIKDIKKMNERHFIDFSKKNKVI